MSVEQTNVIDVIGVDKDTGELVLTISDHLEWDEANEHVLVLQDKINAYLGMLERGGIEQQYPDASGRKILIRVVMLNHPNSTGVEFLFRVKESLAVAGIGFEYTQKHFNSPN